MAQKYMILKAIIQNFSRTSKTSKGFTLIELIVGLSIMLIVGGLAMDALIQSSISFNKDKKRIDSSQSISAIMEIIGNDIKQSGENINDSNFPVIKIEQVASGDPVNMAGSSVITIRRALTTPLTLCEEITGTSTNTTLTVINDSLAEPNCKLGTITTTATTPPIIRPATLKDWRNKRCQLDDINGDYTNPTTADFCLTSKASPDREQVLAAISDRLGHMRTFQYEDDTNAEVTTAGTPSVTTTKYKINMSASGLSADSTTTYGIGSPIYLIEERVYSLDKSNNLKLKREGQAAEILVRKIEKFNVSARVYGDKATRELDVINPAATPVVATNVLPVARRCNSAIPNYICSFNAPYTIPEIPAVVASSGPPPVAASPLVPASTVTPTDDWKTLAGIKVEIQTKYDGTGQNATATTADTDKLKAQAEFFPRNVLSK
jgi:prepilin-type N-terminal cleavage/methylation domain-containing protein